MKASSGFFKIRFFLAAALLLLGQAWAEPRKSDSLPARTGFDGSFSHQGDDSFSFSYPEGFRLQLSRKGQVLAFDNPLQAHSHWKMTKDGKRGELRDETNQLLFAFSYGASGKLVGTRDGKGRVFGIAYDRHENLLSIRFPSREKGFFPMP